MTGHIHRCMKHLTDLCAPGLVIPELPTHLHMYTITPDGSTRDVKKYSAALSVEQDTPVIFHP